jgi:glycosyltransferase involved in cell wall biosynthesis
VRAAITVAISTYESRLDDALRLAKAFRLHGFPILIVHQAKEIAGVLSIDGVQYIHLDSVGVTRSRNAAIEAVSTEYIWFMDDDVTVLGAGVKRLVSSLGQYQGDVFRCRVIDEFGLLRKNYKCDGYRENKFTILNAGTIEIIARRKFLIDSGVRFPTDLGAGSSLPVGDESVFLSAAIDSGATVVSIDCSPVGHPAESSGKVISKTHMKAKKVSIFRVFNSLGWPAFFAYCFVKRAHIKKSGMGFFEVLFL